MAWTKLSNEDLSVKAAAGLLALLLATPASALPLSGIGETLRVDTWAGAVKNLDLYYAVGHRLARSHIWPACNDGVGFDLVRDTTWAERR